MHFDAILFFSQRMGREKFKRRERKAEKSLFRRKAKVNFGKSKKLISFFF